jgi:hypothetical protein
MEKITRDNITSHLIDFQLKMIGKTRDDVKDDPEWYHNNTFTREQLADFNVYALPLIKKVYKCNTNRAKLILSMFDLNFGLRVVPTEEERKDVISKLRLDANPDMFDR